MTEDAYPWMPVTQQMKTEQPETTMVLVMMYTWYSSHGVKLFSLSFFNSEMFIATNIYVTQESIKQISNSEIFAMEIGLDTEILKLIKYQSIQHTVFDNRQSII